MEIAKESPVYGMMAEFDTPEAMMDACVAAREAGYTKIDGFSPFPVEGLSTALNERDSRVPYLTLFGGIMGFCTGYGMQYITGVVTYPINIGGRPLHSWPTFGPPTFELTVLFACITGIVSMIVLNGLPSLYHPVFNVPGFERASTDRFFLLVESKDAKFDVEGTRQFMQSLNPLSVNEVER
ncbi:MAG TPA: DUF3341 domain-containing protein [Abditibacteriaceae bacterium]|jgi:hypothetical protein